LVLLSLKPTFQNSNTSTLNQSPVLLKALKKRDANNLNLQIGCAVSVQVTCPEKGTLKWRLCISRRSVQLAIKKTELQGMHH